MATLTVSCYTLDLITLLCKVAKMKSLYAHKTTNYPFIDPPEITVESPIVYSGEGQEAMLVCIVHGEAQPEVRSSLMSHFT